MYSVVFSRRLIEAERTSRKFYNFREVVVDTNPAYIHVKLRLREALPCLSDLWALHFGGQE